MRKRQKQISTPMPLIQNQRASVLLRMFAASARSPFAVLQHVDASTGTFAEELIIVEPVGRRFLLALPAKADAALYHAVLTAGHGRLRWSGQTYALSKPEPVDAKTGLRAFSPFVRLILRARAAKHFRMINAQLTQN